MIFKLILTLFIFTTSTFTFAKIKVVTTTPDLLWLVKEIGGSHVSVESLLDGTEDPHFADAMPHFVAKVANADMFCLIGLELEVGWAPKVLKRSGNSQVQPGGKGYCETGKSIKALEVHHGKIDRSMGDVHSAGNPHYHLGPQAFLQGGQTIMDTLIALDTKNAQVYLANYQKLEIKIKKIKSDIQSMLKKVKGEKFLQYHKEFAYFFKEYDLNGAGALEEVPGVPPSAGRLARLTLALKGKNIRLVLATKNSPAKLLEKFKQMSRINYLQLPLGIVTTKQGPHEYRELQMTIAKGIIEKIN